jgi:hypothetical protein
MADWHDDSRPAARLGDKGVWLRGFFMLLFVLIWSVVEIVLYAVAVLQFGFTLFTGAPNAPLRRFGATLALFFRDVVRFLTYASDDRPFPFRDWPKDREELG